MKDEGGRMKEIKKGVTPRREGAKRRAVNGLGEHLSLPGSLVLWRRSGSVREFGWGRDTEAARAHPKQTRRRTT